MYLPATQWGPDGAELVVRTKLPPDALASSVMINAAPDQSRAAGDGVSARPATGGSRRLAAPILCSTGRHLRRAGAASGFARHLWRDLLFGDPAHAGDWHPHGFGRHPSQVQFGVIGKTLRLALVGIVAGIVASFAVARLISSLLFGTAPSDPITFAGMILLLGAVAFIAGYIPARRASQIDPMVALRNN